MPTFSSKKQVNIKAILTILVMVCLAVFLIFAFFYQHYILDIAKARVRNHADVISTSLWAYESKAPQAYLTLAVEANEYEGATVFNEHNKEFLRIDGKPYSAFELLLLACGLLHTHTIEEDIFFEEKKIGMIQVVWPCRAIYLYFYIIFCTVLLLVVFVLFLKLLDAKRFLEYRVHRRTLELETEVKERQKAEQLLRDQTQRLAMHVRHTPLAVIEWTTDFKIAEWNKAAEGIFGYSREEALGRNPFELIVPEDQKSRIHTVWKSIISQTGGLISNNINITKSGELKICDWFNTTLTDEEGKLTGAASLALDVTDRVRAEQDNKLLQEQLLQSQKMEAVGNLAGGIAHDFNNLLQGISGYTELLLIDCDTSGKEYQRLKGIDEACLRATRLIRQLLTLSRKVESNPVFLDLNERIGQLRSMLEHTLPKMVKIKLVLEPDLAKINADPVQIEQILLNLALNGNHAMPDGGTLTISTSTIHLDSAFCGQHPGAMKGQKLLLEVADNGIGMKQEVRDRIFEPFFTTREANQGTGLGLSTVYGIVKSHGAYITCTSSPGKGTKFSIFFPVGTEQIESSAQPVQQEIVLGNNERVLIVDDEETIRETGREILSTYGYNPVVATNGEEAIVMYQEQGEDIDLVIMDLNMPGMGGYHCIEKLKVLDPEARIIVASGYAPAESVEKATRLGADGFIFKPFHINKMLKKMNEILQSNR